MQPLLPDPVRQNDTLGLSLPNFSCAGRMHKGVHSNILSSIVRGTSISTRVVASNSAAICSGYLRTLQTGSNGMKVGQSGSKWVIRFSLMRLWILKYLIYRDPFAASLISHFPPFHFLIPFLNALSNVSKSRCKPTFDRICTHFSPLATRSLFRIALSRPKGKHSH